MQKQVLLVLLAGSIISRMEAAETCSLFGVVTAKSGEPVPNVQIWAVSMRAFRTPDYRESTTDSEGKFAFANLRCGKYYVSAKGLDTGGQDMQVDVAKQRNVRLVLPRVDSLALRLGLADGDDPLDFPSTLARPEPATITNLRRDYFAQLNAKELPAFDRATLAQQKQMYVMAYVTILAQLMSPDVSEMQREFSALTRQHGWRGRLPRFSGPAAGDEPATYKLEDMMARKRMSAAAGIVRTSLSAEDADAFLRTDEIERSAYFFRSVAAMPAQTALCSRFALYMVDGDATTEPGMGIGSHMLALIDDQAMAQWGDLDALQRCEIIGRGREALLKIALTLVRDGSESQVAAVARRLGAGFVAPRQTVVEMFGGSSGLKYDASVALPITWPPSGSIIWPPALGIMFILNSRV